MKAAELQAGRDALATAGIHPVAEYPSYIKVAEMVERETRVYVSGHDILVREYPYCYAWQHGRSTSSRFWRRRYEYTVDGERVSYRDLVRLVGRIAIGGGICPACGRDNSEYSGICTSDDCPGAAAGGN